jgi:nicotinamide mononucleotide transporter
MFVFSSAFSWLSENYVEVIAVITGLLYVLYTIKENRILWIFGIISSALYVWIFYNSGIFAYALLYVYYVIIGFYGWYKWKARPEGDNKTVIAPVIQKTTNAQLILFLVITAMIIPPVFYALRKFTSSDMALTDAALTSGGIVATWMLTRKFIEQWIFWIIIDFISFALMIYKQLYPSALLFLVYALLALKGYFEWKKELKLTETN